MSPDRWQEIEAVFQSAMDLSRAEQQAFLNSRCSGDADLRIEVEKLLRNSALADSFIELPVWTDSSFLNSSAKKIISDSLDEDLNGDQPGDFTGLRIGPYRLVNEIGRGGMGAVYRAERVDGEFVQLVAVKLIKRGMDSDFIIRRFRHERQILASFEHPFIARLLDGGTTNDGVPYFVMEFVDGNAIYDWCDKRRLDMNARLKLFLKVCSALEYAHERKIVHRDIKPSNILISRSGAPKLLDFGIAKILDPNLIHESINPTASMMRMMTPDYASPEQVQGIEITPASDTYSLGVLLYELISGHRPYNFVGRSIHEVSRVICEVDPMPPSRSLSEEDTLLSRYLGGPLAFSDARNSSPAELTKVMSGGFDDVVLKAMAKDPADRFASVHEFAEDIQRIVRGENVISRPPSNSKRKDEPSAGRSPTGSKALAVLPFRFMSFSSDEDTDERFLGLGLADALISRLSRVRLFVVRPTSSILSFNDSQIDPIRAGHDLNVDYILDGSIKKAKDRLRVSVQLLNVADNAAVWAASIDEHMSDVFTLEDRLSNKLIEALIPQLTGGEIEEYSRRGTDSPEAFEHYLRGRYYFNSFTEDGLAKAFVSFHQAVAADPNYARAYSGIADYYNWLGIMGVLPPQECFQPAIAAATKAVELDGDLSEGHASLGFSLHAGNYDWKNAELHLEKAIELNPGNASAYVWYSILLFTAARFDQGLQYAHRGAELDPLTPFNHHNIGWGLYFARRFDEAKTQYRKVVEDFPDYSFGYYGLSKIHRITGETKLSLDEADRALEVMGGSIFAQLAKAESLAASGQSKAAEESVADLVRLSENRFVSPYQLALVYCFLGDNESALASLRKAAQVHDAWLNWATVEPVFDVISGDPTFVDILRSVDHPAFDRVGSRAVRRADPTTVAGSVPGLHSLTTLVMERSGSSDEVGTSQFPGNERHQKLWGAIAILILLLLIGSALYLAFSKTADIIPTATPTTR